MSEFITIDLKEFADLISTQDYDNEKVQQVKQQLWKACSGYGFFYIQNHGIDQDIINDLFDTVINY